MGVSVTLDVPQTLEWMGNHPIFTIVILVLVTVGLALLVYLKKRGPSQKMKATIKGNSKGIVVQGSKIEDGVNIGISSVDTDKLFGAAKMGDRDKA